jgi:hypothetical protein
MKYQLKKKATQGDVARISFLLFSTSSLLVLFSGLVLVDLDLFIFFMILFIENSIILFYHSIKRTIFDFSGAPMRPRGWLSSTYLEEIEDRLR